MVLNLLKRIPINFPPFLWWSSRKIRVGKGCLCCALGFRREALLAAIGRVAKRFLTNSYRCLSLLNDYSILYMYRPPLLKPLWKVYQGMSVVNFGPGNGLRHCREIAGCMEYRVKMSKNPSQVTGESFAIYVASFLIEEVLVESKWPEDSVSNGWELSSSTLTQRSYYFQTA